MMRTLDVFQRASMRQGGGGGGGAMSCLCAHTASWSGGWGSGCLGPGRGSQSLDRERVGGRGPCGGGGAAWGSWVGSMSPLRTQERRHWGRRGEPGPPRMLSGAHPRRSPPLRLKGEKAAGSPPVCMWATGVLPWAECSELEKLKQAAKVNRIQIQRCMRRNANL